MRVIIGGSREITDYELVCRVVEVSGILNQISEVVSGKARGVDTLGERWADERAIHVEPFPPDYDRYGRKQAPGIRNGAMSVYADAAILVWDGVSPGTKDMAEKMAARHKPCYLWNMKLHNGGWNKYGRKAEIEQQAFDFGDETKPKRGYGE